VPTVVNGDCEWHSDKAESNLAKHGVAFEEAMTVFADPTLAYLDDGSGSGRLLALGMSNQGRLLAVVYVDRGKRDRIVSARPATRTETDTYAESKPT
jgi:uncharacterized DUF497 family protein